MHQYYWKFEFWVALVMIYTVLSNFDLVAKFTVKNLNKDFINAVRGGGVPVLWKYFIKFRYFFNDGFPKSVEKVNSPSMELCFDFVNCPFLRWYFATCAAQTCWLKYSKVRISFTICLMLSILDALGILHQTNFFCFNLIFWIVPLPNISFMT